MSLDREFDDQAAAETGLMRRGFFKWLIRGVSALYGVAFAVPVYRFLRTGNVEDTDVQVTEITLNSALDLSVGGFQLFRFGSKPAIVIRQSENEFKAYLATCTHLGCTVSYSRAQRRITCACHGGQYDPDTGKNIAGPPPAPLTALQTEVSSDGQFVVKA